MTTSNSSSTSIQVGARVMSADGKQLGLVKDARYDRFLVDVRWAPDYWLGTETVERADKDIVQLIITKEAVGSAKFNTDIAGPGLG